MYNEQPKSFKLLSKIMKCIFLTVITILNFKGILIIFEQLSLITKDKLPFIEDFLWLGSFSEISDTGIKLLQIDGTPSFSMLLYFLLISRMLPFMFAIIIICYLFSVTKSVVISKTEEQLLTSIQGPIILCSSWLTLDWINTFWPLEKIIIPFSASSELLSLFISITITIGMIMAMNWLYSSLILLINKFVQMQRSTLVVNWSNYDSPETHQENDK
ncbi:hypothetical protein D7X33_21650 [Butyricicoccus sp. 1XD8-22]|nr:hypothetical protein D7X33_21650 [Butyricicoccus sp. 1XD8-22]